MGPLDTSADFRSAPQEFFNSQPAAKELNTAGIAQDENVETPPLQFEPPEPFLRDHDDPNSPLRPLAQPSIHNHQEHDNDTANPPDIKVILSSEAPAPSPLVQGTQRKPPPGSSSPPCTSTPPAFTIHPTLISTALPSPAALPTSDAPSRPLPSSLPLLPTAVVANTTTNGNPFGVSPTTSGTALPVAFSALHTVPFYVSVAFGSIAGAALLAALVAWGFRFRSAARMRREERIFNCPGNAGRAGYDEDEDGSGWAAWWSRPFMNRVGSGRESLATIDTSSVSDFVGERTRAGAPANIGGVGPAVPETVWREWEQATGMSFGREMGVGSGTDMAMRRTVSSKRRHQARGASGEGLDTSLQGEIPQRRSSYYVHPPPQTYDSPTQPLENPFARTQPRPHAVHTRDLARTSPRGSARSVGMGLVGLPRMESLGSGVGLGLGLDLSSDGGMLRVTNRAEGDGMSVNTASRANTAMGMHDDDVSLSPSPTPSTTTSTVRPLGSDSGKTPSAGPLPSFPSFPSVLNAIKTTFSAAFSPSPAQAEEDKFTRAPERCGIKKARPWTGLDMDGPGEEGEKTTEATKPLSVSKRHSRRYSSARPSSNNARRLSLMRGVSAKRVRDSFPVGLSRRRGSRVDMRRLGSCASSAGRAGGTSRMGGRSSTRGSGGSGGWEDLDARSDYGFEEEEEGSIRDDEDDEGRPRFLTRASAASFLSSVSGVSTFSVNSSREELMTEREAEARGVLAARGLSEASIP